MDNSANGSIHESHSRLEQETERLKQVEATLRESEKRYRNLVELSFDGIVIHTEAEIVYANTAGLHILGVEKQEDILGRSIYDFLHCDYIDPTKQRMKQILKTGNGSPLIEEKIVRPDGVIVDIEAVGILITYQDKQAIMSVFRDITERKQTEEAVRNSEVFLRNIIEQNIASMWISDDKGTLIQLNRACMNTLNIAAEEVVGKYNIFNDDVLKEQGLIPSVRKVFEKGKTVKFILEYDSSKLKNLNLHNVIDKILEVVISPVVDNNGVVTNAIIQHFDITERKQAEKELIESERRFRELLENVKLLAVMLDNDAKIIYCNDFLSNLIGRRKEDIIGRDWFATFVPEDVRGNVKIVFDEIIASGKLPSYFENELLLHNGEKRLVAWNNTILRDIDGAIIGTTSLGEDITESRRNEEALKASLIKMGELEEIIKNSPAVAILWRVEEGWPVEFISENINQFGYESGDFYSGRLHFSQIIHPDDNERIIAEVDQYHSNDPSGYLTLEYRVITAGGDVRWIENRVWVRIDETGFISHFQGIIMDVTERKNYRDRLQNLAKFPSENPNPVMKVLKDGVLVYANSASRQLLDFWKCHVGQRLPDDILAHTDEVLQTGENKNIEVAFDNRVHSLAIASVGDTDYVNIYGLDITEQRKAEEERKKLEAQIQHAQKLESLGVLAGGIAHDFNNLLVGILGNADLALMEISPLSPARDTLEEVKKAAIRASELTNQMLAYSGKGKFIIDAIDVNELINEMMQMFEISISKKAVLKRVFEKNLPPVEGDVSQLRQIIMNLITNASDALGESSGNITISTSLIDADRDYLSEMQIDQELPEGGYISIVVSDTGCGMDPETKDKIFYPFFSTKFTGRGLGLSAVLGIVRGHNGAIKVYSEPEKGTTFRVLLPIASHLQQRKKTTTACELAPMKGEGTILVVDDEESVRNVIERMLQRLNFTVLTAKDGLEGLHLFQEHVRDIRLVLLDMTMPILSGEEAFREMKKIKPDVKVILTSGFNEQDATNRFAGEGLAGFVQKPFQLNSLVAKITEILSIG